MMFKKNKDNNKAKLEHKLYLARETPEPIFDLSDCGIKDVPSGIFSLCKVFLKEVLLLDHNKLTSLDHGGSIGDLRNLKVLNIQDNLFTSLPKDIALLVNLKELYISNNKLKHLTSAIGSLVNLCILDLSNNELKELPKEIGNLTKLENLNISKNNKLDKLPSSLCYCRNLIVLNLDTNNFTYPPKNIAEDGVESIIKFLCFEKSVDYMQPSTLVENERKQSKPSASAAADEVDWKIQKQKQMEILKIEKEFQEMHLKEIAFQEVSKANRLKVLGDITQQQSHLESEIIKIQNMKEQDKLKLIKELQEDEAKSDFAISQLLNLNNEIFSHFAEQQQKEDERLLLLTTKNEDLRRNDILEAMQVMLEKEAANFKQYDKNREETTRTVLVQELLSNHHLKEVLRNQEIQQAELVLKLQKDMELQKSAVGALLEQSDACTWSLIQQVLLVESQLAKLNGIEMERRKLQMDECLNELADKRVGLSMLLVDLLSQQEERRAQLVSTLNDMEQMGNSQKDFWLLQYQQLLDRRPELTNDAQRNIDRRFAHELLVAGMIHYLPFLANWIQSAAYDEDLTDAHLIEAGVKSSDDRLKIIEAYNRYKDLLLHDFDKVQPSAPCETPVEDVAASAPFDEPINTISSSECVICMDMQCEMIFIPCGHLCCCSKCALLINECPLCRAAVERRIKIMAS